MSSGFPLELQKGLRAALVADSCLTALVAARVYDEPPQAPIYPFVRFGGIQPRSADTDGRTGAEVTFNVEGYLQTAGRFEATQIAQAVRNAQYAASIGMPCHAFRVKCHRVTLQNVCS